MDNLKNSKWLGKSQKMKFKSQKSENLWISCIEAYMKTGVPKGAKVTEEIGFLEMGILLADTFVKKFEERQQEQISE